MTALGLHDSGSSASSAALHIVRNWLQTQTTSRCVAASLRWPCHPPSSIGGSGETEPLVCSLPYTKDIGPPAAIRGPKTAGRARREEREWGLDTCRSPHEFPDFGPRARCLRALLQDDGRRACSAPRLAQDGG